MTRCSSNAPWRRYASGSRSPCPWYAPLHASSGLQGWCARPTPVECSPPPGMTSSDEQRAPLASASRHACAAPRLCEASRRRFGAARPGWYQPGEATRRCGAPVQPLGETKSLHGLLSSTALRGRRCSLLDWERGHFPTVRCSGGVRSSGTPMCCSAYPLRSYTEASYCSPNFISHNLFLG